MTNSEKDEFDDPFIGEDGRPNKTALKRESEACKELGKKLTELKPAQLATIPLDDELQQALTDYRRFKHKEAKRRQLQLIAKLIRDDDRESIEKAWEQTQAGSVAAKNQLHKIERWRDRLLQEGDAAVNELLNEYPQMERQTLRQFIRDANKQQELNKPPMASRKLFQYLKDSLD